MALCADRGNKQGGLVRIEKSDRRSGGEDQTGLGRRVRNRRLDFGSADIEKRTAERRAGCPRRGGAVTYSLSWSLLEVTMEGHFTVEEALAIFAGGLASIPSGSKPDVLIDTTRSQEHKRLPDYERLAMLLAEHAGSLSGRIGILVSGPLRLALSRQFSSLVEQHGFEACAFEDRSHAFDWLNAGRPPLRS